MRSELLTDEHRMFLEAFSRFLEAEVVPHHAQWEREGLVSREVWQKAGRAGFLCMDVPETFGGLGVRDFRFQAIVTEELARHNFHGPGFAVHTDMVVPYITRLGTEEQKTRWLPGLVSGELIAAVAMTEPNTGSDLAGVRTKAERRGDHFLLNGQKTFISNGILADIVVVVARTEAGSGARGLSLIVVERGMAGFERGRNLDKVGMHAQDTAELFFKDVAVPAGNLLGEAGRGFYYLMDGLAQERLSIALGALASAEAAVEMTRRYCQERMAFGRPVGTFQSTRFTLAEMATEVEIGRVFADHCILEHNAGRLTAVRAAMAKWWLTEMAIRHISQGVQLHGGYGYMEEYPIARLFRDTRAQTIYGGTTEIMKEVIGRALGLEEVEGHKNG